MPTSASISDDAVVALPVERLTNFGTYDCKGIADGTLEHWQNAEDLEGLTLAGTSVTDAGLEHLKPRKDLDWLNLQGARVTEEGVTRLQEVLPACTIVSDFHPETP